MACTWPRDPTDRGTAADGTDRSRAEKYAFIQSQVLFWGLYGVAISFVATHVGVRVAVFVFSSGIVLTTAAFSIGIRRERKRNR